jgi:hypothetical protein
VHPTATSVHHPPQPTLTVTHRPPPPTSPHHPAAGGVTAARGTAFLPLVVWQVSEPDLPGR